MESKTKKQKSYSTSFPLPPGSVAPVNIDPFQRISDDIYNLVILGFDPAWAEGPAEPVLTVPDALKDWHTATLKELAPKD